MALCINTFSELALRSPSVFDDSFLLVMILKSPPSSSFFPRRVSIIRGRVVTMTGQGIIGVRVSVDRTKDANNYGFTLTRPGGW